ncbi:MAG: hypothetical protein IKO26_00060 [Paludibacteraceae bacterium]|nr:hypothetical protein [Paludibacteraceae bacterium]
MGFLNFARKVKNGIKELGSRTMQGLNAIGVGVGTLIERGALALNWNSIAQASKEFVENRELSRQKWKERAERAQRDRIIGENIKPENSVPPTKEMRALAEQCIQIVENNISSKSLNECLASQTPEERMEFIQKLANDFQEKTKIILNPVQYYANPGLDFGFYNREDNSIHINAVFLTSDNIFFVKEQVFTLFHEMMHALQWHSVKQVVETGKADLFSANQVAEWAENFLPGRYIRSGVDFEGYRNQPLERDAYWLEWAMKNQFD